MLGVASGQARRGPVVALTHPGDPRICEPYVTSALGYIFPWGGGVLIGYQTIRNLDTDGLSYRYYYNCTLKLVVGRD